MSEDTKAKVYDLLGKVPKGRVTTYKNLAAEAGTHPRAVAMYMKHNEDPVKIPCYKVVRSDGSPGGYSSGKGIPEKIALLKRDGIEIKNGKIDLNTHKYAFRKINKTAFQ